MEIHLYKSKVDLLTLLVAAQMHHEGPHANFTHLSDVYV